MHHTTHSSDGKIVTTLYPRARIKLKLLVEGIHCDSTTNAKPIIFAICKNYYKKVRRIETQEYVTHR